MKMFCTFELLKNMICRSELNIPTKKYDELPTLTLTAHDRSIALSEVEFF